MKLRLNSIVLGLALNSSLLLGQQSPAILGVDGFHLHESTRVVQLSTHKYWSSTRFQIEDAKIAGPDSPEIELFTCGSSPKTIDQHKLFFRRFYLMSGGASEKVHAVGSIRALRTAQIEDGQGNLLGSIHKKWMTGLSGLHTYEIKDAGGSMVAGAKVEREGAYKKIIVRTGLDEVNDPILASIELPRAFNPAQDRNNDYNTWRIEIQAAGKVALESRMLDPRMLVMLASYATYWDYSTGVLDEPVAAVKSAVQKATGKWVLGIALNSLPLAKLGLGSLLKIAQLAD